MAKMTETSETGKAEETGAGENVGAIGADDVIYYQPSASWRLFRSIGRFAARAFLPRKRRP